MKHRNFAVAAALAATFCFSLGFAGCKPETPPEPTPEHTHTFSDWMTDEKNHWRECTECHEKLVEQAHSFDNVTGFEYPAYTGDDPKYMPMLHVTAPEGKTGEIYIKEVWVCLTPKEGATLRVAYSTYDGGTFASHVDIPADQGGWTQAVFPRGGLPLKTYSYFRLQAVDESFTIREIVLIARDEAGEGEPFLMKLENVGEGNNGQEGERRKGLIDEQQFPNEKRECTVCHYPEPKTE